MATDSELTLHQKRQKCIQDSAEHILDDSMPGATQTITYVWKSSAGTKMYIHVGVDEYGVLNSMFINVGASGSTIHNVVNAMGRVISIAIQRDKATALEIVQTLEDVTSELVWMNDCMGRTNSIPGVISIIILRHVDIEECIERIHTDFTSEEDADVHEDNHGANH